MQQLLDKWERLRKSEYLRPDEKLMLNHCISDLKRFMDHSGEVNEMVGKMYYTEFEVLQLLLKLQQTESYDNLYDWFQENKKQTFNTKENGGKK